METTTVAGHVAYVYPNPNEPDATVLKGCVVLRSLHPWHTGEARHLVEWNKQTGKCIFTDRFGKKFTKPTWTDWDLVVETNDENHPNDLVMEKEETNVEEDCNRPRSFWRSLWNRCLRNGR